MNPGDVIWIGCIQDQKPNHTYGHAHQAVVKKDHLGYHRDSVVVTYTDNPHGIDNGAIRAIGSPADYRHGIEQVFFDEAMTDRPYIPPAPAPIRRGRPRGSRRPNLSVPADRQPDRQGLPQEGRTGP